MFMVILGFKFKGRLKKYNNAELKAFLWCIFFPLNELIFQENFELEMDAE